MEKYIVVQWPESQDLQAKEDFDQHAYPILDDQGLNDFGDSAYFVELEWYKEVAAWKES